MNGVAREHAAHSREAVHYMVEHKKSTHRLAQSVGDCPYALSVSASRVRLGQDRLGGVLESGTVRVFYEE